MPAEGLLASGMHEPRLLTELSAMASAVLGTGYSGGAAQDFNLLP